MLSIVERQGPGRLEALASRRELPDMLSMPDVAVILAREFFVDRSPDCDDITSDQFMQLVMAIMNILTNAVLSEDLKCGAKFYCAEPADQQEQYSLSVVAWPWMTWHELVCDYISSVKEYGDGKLAEKPTHDKENGLVDVRIRREDFRAWCGRQRYPLPAAWFSDSEIAEHTAAISKPTAGAAAANARFRKAREFAEQVYRNSLAEDPDCKPGAVAKVINGAIANDPREFGLTSAPKIDTIKGWISHLAPEHTRRPGRPRK